MSTARVVYGSDGTHYFVGDREVGEAEYHAALPSRLDEMFRDQTPPGCVTDNTFLAGRGGAYAQFSEDDIGGNFYRKEALKAGVNPHGKVYMPSLASRPGDPEAWVSGRGDVRRVCEQRGWGVEGAGMNIPVTNVAPVSEKYEPAPDLVADRMEQLKAKDPGLKGEDLAGKAKESLMPAWGK